MSELGIHMMCDYSEVSQRQVNVINGQKQR